MMKEATLDIHFRRVVAGAAESLTLYKFTLAWNDESAMYVGEWLKSGETLPRGFVKEIERWVGGGFKVAAWRLEDARLEEDVEFLNWIKSA